MFASRGALEQTLEADLDKLFGGLADDWSSIELYRALCSTRWSKLEGTGGHVELTPDRVGALINTVRGHQDKSPLEFHLSGGEGEVSERAAQMLESLGWQSESSGRFTRDTHAGETQ